MGQIITNQLQNQFLQTYGIYFEWLEATSLMYPDGVDLTDIGSNFIAKSFFWDDTPKGLNYWSGYDTLYMQHFSKHLINT